MKNSNQLGNLPSLQNGKPVLRNTPLDRIQSKILYSFKQFLGSDNAFQHFVGHPNFQHQSNILQQKQTYPNQIFNNLQQMNQISGQPTQKGYNNNMFHNQENLVTFQDPNEYTLGGTSYNNNQDYYSGEQNNMPIQNQYQYDSNSQFSQQPYEINNLEADQLNHQFSQNLSLNELPQSSRAQTARGSNNNQTFRSSVTHNQSVSNNEEVDEIKKRLKELFNYYSSFGDRLNVSNLKSSKFHKMMQDAEIFSMNQSQSSQMDKKKLDLIFCQVNKHKPNMTFENFLQSLTKIAEYKFQEMNKIDGLQELINNYLVPLAEKVSAQKLFISKEHLFDIEFDELVSILVKNVGSVLLEVYYIYFQHEIRANEAEDKTKKINEKQVFEFLRDFDICPTLINKGIAYKIFLQCYDSPLPVYHSTGCDLIEQGNQQISQKTIGRFFTFLKFIDFLKQNIEKKQNHDIYEMEKQVQPKFPSLIEQIIEEYSDRLQRIFQYYCLYGEPLNNSKLKSSKFIKLLKDSNILVKGVLTSPSDESQSFRDRTQDGSGYSQVYGISQIEADLIFKKLTSSYNQPKSKVAVQPQQKRMDFEQFVRSLIHIGQKMYGTQSNDPKVTFDVLLESNVTFAEAIIQQNDKGGLNSQQHISQLMEILRDEQIIEILSCVHKSILPYYQYYSNQKGYLNFDGFSKFCHDFGIFPDILNKSKIMRFFSTLSSFYQSTNGGSPSENVSRSYNTSFIQNQSICEPQNSKDVIDEHLFVEALALTALEISYKDPQPREAEKIIILMERMNHSEGPAKVQRSSGRTRFGSGENNDLLFVIRQSFPQYFKKHSQSQIELQSYNNDDFYTFDQLLEARQY
eukprot:403361442